MISKHYIYKTQITFLKHEMMTFQLNMGTFTIMLRQLHNYKETHTVSGDSNIQEKV